MSVAFLELRLNMRLTLTEEIRLQVATHIGLSTVGTVDHRNVNSLAVVMHSATFFICVISIL